MIFFKVTQKTIAQLTLKKFDAMSFYPKKEFANDYAEEITRQAIDVMRKHKVEPSEEDIINYRRLSRIAVKDVISSYKAL